MGEIAMVRPHYAVISYNTVSGPIKSFQGLAAAHRHNARVEDLDHVDPSSMKAMRIVGPDNLVAELKSRFERLNIKPRANAVLAWELVCTSDRAYFLNEAGVLDVGRMALWSAESIKFLMAYFGTERVLSVDLHPDEYTIHLHPVIVPLVHKDRGRFGPRWTLDVRTISGPGEWQKLQTEYAKAMAPLGLERGVERSGARHKPYFEVLADLAKATKQAEEAEEAADQARQFALLATIAIAAMHQRLVERMAEITQLEAEWADEIRKSKRAIHVLAGSIRTGRELQEALRGVSIATLSKPLADALRHVGVLRERIDSVLTEDLLSPSVIDYIQKAKGAGRK